MCGRFVRTYTWADLQRLYALQHANSNLQPRYNICPTTQIDTVVELHARRHLVPMRWGLVPAWWSKPLKELRLATFNARVETVAEKPFFRSSFKRKRCLIPATGYYEWHTEGKEKQPYYFTRRDGQTIAIAGLWDEWKNPETKKPLLSCTMIIGPANKFVSQIHERMPVILEAKDFEQWEHGDVKDAAALMKPASEDVLQKWSVSKRVNSSRADGDDATLIEKTELAV
jgi:putative SOS response-associated peptidase YedK